MTSCSQRYSLEPKQTNSKHGINSENGQYREYDRCSSKEYRPRNKDASLNSKEGTSMDINIVPNVQRKINYGIEKEEENREHSRSDKLSSTLQR